MADIGIKTTTDIIENQGKRLKKTKSKTHKNVKITCSKYKRTDANKRRCLRF